jgi:2-polyprenyl-6-hydroxyphenyl methylase / 3-demethylubiquinone-9 3-methyltransferase
MASLSLEFTNLCTGILSGGPVINNEIYEEYGGRWYTAYDDPIALLRAENEAKWPWVHERIKKISPSAKTILDVGCGAGFLANKMATLGYEVSGVDLSPESLRVAQKFDHTKSVKYHHANAYDLPFPNDSFDVVVTMDFLEHVYHPGKIVSECARVLKLGGLFFYHTFNRNPVSEAIVIKFVERFVKNTPQRMHLIELFIRPEELMEYCSQAKLHNLDLTGIRPMLSSFSIKDVFKGVVPKTLRFTTTNDLTISYMGLAQKN